MAGVLKDTDDPAWWEVARGHQAGALGDRGREVAHAQLGDPAVDQQLPRPRPHLLTWVETQQRRDGLGYIGPAGVHGSLEDLAALHVTAEHQSACLTGAGIAAVHRPAVWSLGAGHDHGAQARAAEDKPFGDELLHSAGGSLVANAVLTAEFGSAGQLVAGGVVRAGLIEAGQDVGADGVGDLAIGRLPREGHEVASQGSSSRTGLIRDPSGFGTW